MNQPAPTASRPPKSRGRIMDFTPRKPIITPNPRTVEQPVIRMPAQSPQPSVVQVSRPAAPAPRPKPRPQSAPPVRYVAPAQPTPKRPLSKPAPAPVAPPAPEPETPKHSKPASPAKKPAPLGVRSPFFKKSVSVEKRPLSGGAASVTHSRSAHQPVHDLPRTQIQRSSAIKLANRKSKLPMILLIIGTILVGAAVGACAYFLVFQGE